MDKLIAVTGHLTISHHALPLFLFGFFACIYLVETESINQDVAVRGDHVSLPECLPCNRAS